MYPNEAFVLSSVEVKSDSVMLSGDKPVSTIQISKIGDFKSKRYGKFSITEKHVDQMVDNRAKSVNDPPVDYHHLSMSAVIPDQAVAAGWMKSLEKRDDSSIWATVEWTPKAAQHIRDGEFKYISPVIVWDTKNEQGDSIGATIMSAALTNYPFLQGLAPVMLSELQAQGIVLTDLSIDQKRARLSDALQKYHTDSTSYCYIRDVYDDYLVYDLGSKMYKIGYSIDSKFVVAFTSTPEEVVPQYVSLSADGGKKTMAGENTPNADVVKLQSDFATLQSQLTDLSTKHVALSAQLETEQTTNKTLRDQINKTAAETQVDGLIRQGKLVPKQRDKMVELAIKDPIFFNGMAVDLPVVVKLSKVHGTNDGDEDAAQLEDDDPIKLFDDKVAEYRTAHPTANFNDILQAVDKANPGLYEKRRLRYAATTAVTNASVQ